MHFRDLFTDAAPLEAFLVASFGNEVVAFPGSAGRFAALRIPADRAEEIAPEVLRFMRSTEHTLEATARIHSGDEAMPGDVARDRFVFHTGGEPCACTVVCRDRVVWEGSLHDGDALYIPFGQQATHVAAPHLVLELLRPSAVELLAWAARAARFEPELQEPAPFFAGPAVRAEYLDRTRRYVDRFLASPPLFETFRRRMNGQALPREIPGDPPSVPAAEAAGGDVAELTAPRPLFFFPKDSGSFMVHTGGKHLEFPNEALPVVRTLESSAPITLARLRSEFASFEPDDLHDLLDVLAANAVIRIARPGETD